MCDYAYIADSRVLNNMRNITGGCSYYIFDLSAVHSKKVHHVTAFLQQRLLLSCIYYTIIVA